MSLNNRSYIPTNDKILSKNTLQPHGTKQNKQIL